MCILALATDRSVRTSGSSACIISAGIMPPAKYSILVKVATCPNHPQISNASEINLSLCISVVVELCDSHNRTIKLQTFSKILLQKPLQTAYWPNWKTAIRDQQRLQLKLVTACENWMSTKLAIL